MNLQTAIEEFAVEQLCRGNSEKTVRDYRQKLGRFVDFAGNVDVLEISLPLLRSWYMTLRQSSISSISVQSYIRSLRAFLKWLFYEEYIPVDLTIKFRLPKARMPYIDVLTDDEIDRILNFWPNPGRWLEARNRVIVCLLIDCGLRLNEIVTARKENLHLKERYLIVDGKGDRQRAVVFGTETQRHLQDYLSRAPDFPLLLISGSTFNHPNWPLRGITRETINDLVRVVREGTGVKRFRSHLCRHTFATRFAENGGGPLILKELLGHSSIKMSMHYVHRANTHVRREFVNFSPLDRLEDGKKATLEGGGKEWCTSRDSNPGPTD